MRIMPRRSPIWMDKAGLAGLALRVVVALTIWSERRRTRHRLLALDDRPLRDVGLDRLTALREANRVFWRV